VRNRAEEITNGWRRLLLAAGVALLALRVVAGVLTAPSMQAQAPAAQSSSSPADRPSFDVASIKPNKSGDNRILTRVQPGGLYRSTNVTLNMLITGAYQLKPQQLSGLPEWGDSEHFDIEAKAEGNPARDQISLMMQSLLADRFKLMMHHETRQLPIYALLLSKAGKTGPQLQPHSDDSKCPDLSAGPPPPPPGPPGPGPALPPAPCGGFFMFGSTGKVRMAGQKITMENLAATLSRQLDRVIVDKTGLSGLFDANLEFAPLPGQFGSQLGADAGASDPAAPASIFTALQEQLGLKLEAQKGPVDVLVIDHVEKPSPN